jgi:uncharacterized membrane protein
MDLGPLLHASPIIQIHAACALLALCLGALQFFRKKGDATHKAVGRTWVGLMAVVALSSFFIWQIRMFGLFSPIHLLSIATLVLLWRGVIYARRRQIALHRRVMQGTYLLGLVITGLFTFFPGRIMYRVAFGPEGATPGSLAVAALLLAAVAAAVMLVMRWRRTPPGRAYLAAH